MAVAQIENGGVLGIGISRDDAGVPRVPSTRGSHREERCEAEPAAKQTTDSGIPKHGPAFSNHRTTQ
jgi:hypothetical protein